jgi:hypothetical protein
MLLHQEAFEPDFIQGHAHARVLPQGADFFRLSSTVECVVLPTELDEVFEMLRGGATGAGFPTDHGLP